MHRLCDVLFSMGRDNILTGVCVWIVLLLQVAVYSLVVSVSRRGVRGPRGPNYDNLTIVLR